MKQNLTTCPNCGHQFDAGEALQKHLEIELKKSIEAQEKENEKKKKKLNEKRAKGKRVFEKEEKKKRWPIAKAKPQNGAKEKNSVHQAAPKKENEKKQKKIIQARQKK